MRIILVLLLVGLGVALARAQVATVGGGNAGGVTGLCQQCFLVQGGTLLLVQTGTQLTVQ
jgi:hypothetical protein